jgi:hypothetical protein
VTLRKIISGGQTGADQGALAAAKILGIDTGGWMPQGFRTQTFPRPEFRDIYGMFEHTRREYPPRTAANVRWGTATLIFGNPTSLGCKLTERLCKKHRRPVRIVHWRSGWSIDRTVEAMFREWVIDRGIDILNVAGNREESQPGIHVACRDFLVAALS